jgi:hypothetical protein
VQRLGAGAERREPEAVDGRGVLVQQGQPLVGREPLEEVCRPDRDGQLLAQVRGYVGDRLGRHGIVLPGTGSRRIRVRNGSTPRRDRATHRAHGATRLGPDSGGRTETRR